MLRHIRGKVSKAVPFSGLLYTQRWISSNIPISDKVLNLKTIPKSILEAEYAVRGALAVRAEKITQEINSGKSSLSNVTSCNIGNPQQLGQLPITFFRQVAALTEYPDLLNNPKALSGLFPEDAIERATETLKYVKSLGAYSHSQGVPWIRKRVADFINKRDGFPSNPEHVFLTSGASSGVQISLQFLLQSSKVGVLIPIPQYPLYTATLSLLEGRAVPYYLDENKEWGLDLSALKANLKKARAEGTDVRAIVIINPGNPTGQCLTEENMKEIISLCKKEKLVLLADEVYQTNSYQPKDRPFHSFKKILKKMGNAYDDVELISFHSISKGVVGECGRRGGYLELTNIDPDIVAQMYKVASIGLCPNLPGQVLVDLMLHPPQHGQASYPLYKKEVDGIYDSLIRRSKKLAEAFNSMEGISCNEAQGAMYLFPRIQLPKRAIMAAKEAGQEPDAFYAMRMLNSTGVCVVPGSGFGQQEGTYHFRATFLPPEEKFDDFISELGKFHKEFIAEFK